MPLVDRSQAGELFTQTMIRTYTDRLAPTGYFRSMFSTTTSNTRYVSTRIRRYSENVTFDVLRGSNGNRNQISKHTQKTYEPPFYHEIFDLTSLEVYNNVFSRDQTNEDFVQALAEEAMEEAVVVMDIINRSYERNCVQALELGVVTLQNGDDIDLKRKPVSIVDVSGSGGYWDAGSTDIKGNFITGANFLRQQGKMSGTLINVTMGSAALNAFLSSSEVINEADTRWKKSMMLDMPADAPEGAVFHGQYSAGSYTFNIYSYPQFYGDSGSMTSYWPTNKVLMTPAQGYEFVMAYAGTPMVFESGQDPLFGGFIRQVQAEFNMYTYLDRQKFTHSFGIMSSALPITVSVDQVYTMTVLAP